MPYDKQGRIDLVELGLVSGDKQVDQNIGKIALAAVKNISARLRRETQEPKPDTDNM
jgi:hypothetical protein